MGCEEGNTGSLPDGKPSKVKWLLHNFKSKWVIYQLLKELNINSGRIGVVSSYSLDQVDRIPNPYHPW
jgi:hypothetical protein